MLIDDPDVAVNEVIIACQEVADRYTDAGGIVQDGSLRKLFNTLASQRRAAADQLAELIRDRGGLPHTVDIEQEQLHILWSHLKQTLTGHDDSMLLKEIVQQETQLQATAGTALALKLDTAAREIIDQVRRESLTAFTRLSHRVGQ